MHFLVGDCSIWGYNYFQLSFKAVFVLFHLFSSFSNHKKLKYLNDLKFSDRQFWANSVDPNQTAVRGAV